MKIIEVIVSPTGETKIATQGFAGSTCQQASQFLEQALGAQQNEKLTAEFYQKHGVEQHLQQGGAP